MNNASTPEDENRETLSREFLSCFTSIFFTLEIYCDSALHFMR